MASDLADTPRAWSIPQIVAALMRWRAVLAPGVVLQKQSHGLQRSSLMRGPDVEGARQQGGPWEGAQSASRT